MDEIDCKWGDYFFVVLLIRKIDFFVIFGIVILSFFKDIMELYNVKLVRED